MLEIAGIDHIVLNTHQIKAMLLFYCDILGCPIEKKQPDIKLTQLRAGNCLIDLIETNDKPGRIKNMDHFCLQVKDFDYEQISLLLKNNNITFSRYGKRYGAQGYAHSLFIEDPEGNTVELVEKKS